MNPLKTASSAKSQAAEAAADIRSQLGGAAPKMVLYFASSTYPPAEIAAAMEKAFAPATVTGCTTAGEIVSGAMLKKSVVAMAFGADAVADVDLQLLRGLRAGRNEVPAAFDAFGRHFGVGMRQLDPAKHVGLVLFDGLSSAEERIMDAIGAHTDVTFVGGSAGDDLAFQATHVFAQGKALADAAVLVVMRVERGFGVLKTQSFACMGKRLVATRVLEEERAVLEFDGKPAARAYAEALGVPVEKLQDEFARHPVGLMAGDEPFVRSPSRLDGDAVKFFCAIRQGMELEILRSTDIVEETRRALEQKTRELGRVSGIVNFNCILRTLELEKKGQAQAYGGLFSSVPTVGFSTYGEEFLGHVNQTATMLVMK